jgi:hypothetical protein
MKKLMCIAVLVLGLSFCLAPPETSATTLLIDQVDPYLGYGYGLYSWTGMTTALNNAFGAANITVSTSPLDNLSYLLSFNRLWITAGSPGDQLTATEISNVEAFEATGRRVVLIGENGAWTAWNNSILQTVGGSYSGIDTSDTLHPVIVNQLTAGITTLNTIIDGLAVGGTPLFNENVATLWDPSQSVLSLLSVNVIDDTYGAGPGNMQFKVNMADWLAGTSVPEPCTMLLLGSGLVGLVAFRKKFSA